MGPPPEFSLNGLFTIPFIGVTRNNPQYRNIGMPAIVAMRGR